MRRDRADTLSLIKPGRAFNESFQRIFGHRQPFSIEVVAKEIKTFLNPPDERLVEMLGQIQRRQPFVDGPNSSPQLPARRREHQNVVSVLG
jgi:hypothetical protein